MNSLIGKKCPYCKTEIKKDDDIVVCSECHMPHHKSCWIENQCCTTFGCNGTIDSPKEEAVQEFNFELSDFELVKCTGCGCVNSIFNERCVSCGMKIHFSNK